MYLQPITTGSYTEIDGQDQRGEYLSTGSFVATTFVVSPGKIEWIVDNNSLFGQIEHFKIEREYLKGLIGDNKFLKENQGKYIAIRSLKILGIDSNFSDLARKVYKNKSNIGKVLLKKISDKEEVIHLDSPIY